jgi:hypothetical protein
MAEEKSSQDQILHHRVAKITRRSMLGIVLKPGRPERLTRDLADPELEPGQVEKKQGKEKPSVTRRLG